MAKAEVCKTFIQRFKSARRLLCCRDGGIGRRKGLKIPRTLHVRAGSIPAPGTKKTKPAKAGFFIYLEKNTMKAIIFDMDGVISDSEPCHVEAEKRLFKPYGIHLTTEYLQKFMGKYVTDLLGSIIHDHNLDVDIQTHLPVHQKNLVQSYRENALPIDGALDLIKTLAKAGIPLGLASSSVHLLIDVVLEKFHIRSYFKAVVSGEDVKRTKPNPDIFLETARRLNVIPKACIVIEDSGAGVCAAKSAGMFCIGYRSANSGHQDFSLADVIIDDLRMISPDWMLEKYNQWEQSHANQKSDSLPN